MDKDGYPEQSELDEIRQWDVRDVFNLIEYIKSIWQYDTSIREAWVKDNVSGYHALVLCLHTTGWSGNESIIESLLLNAHFSLMWYQKWIRGGHYYFKINPSQIGYKKVSKMAKEKGVSRQQIHKDKDSYDWITAGKRNKLCREKIAEL